MAAQSNIWVEWTNPMGVSQAWSRIAEAPALTDGAAAASATLVTDRFVVIYKLVLRKYCHLCASAARDTGRRGKLGYTKRRQRDPVPCWLKPLSALTV